MFETTYRRRVRPSRTSLVYSASLAVVTALFALWTGIIGLQLYAPAAIAAASALAILLFRVRNLRLAFPHPYGQGRVTKIDSRKSMRDGVLIIVGAALSIGGVFASAYLVSPLLIFFPVVIGLMIGLPCSQLLFFAFVLSSERAVGSKIYAVSEETTEDGRAVLLKSVELSAKRPEDASRSRRP